MIFLRGASQLVTLRGPAPPRRGNQLSDLGVIPDGALLIDGERIHQVGATRRIENLAAARSAKVIDVTGKVVLPGFADTHTRLILMSLPSHQGAPAPGPLPTTTPPRPSLLRPGSPTAVRNRARGWLQQFAAHGTTAVESRTGLRLDLQSEAKALRVARALDGSPLDVSRAFLAGGVTPDEPARSDADVEQITEVLLPMIRQRRLASWCDVECGPGAFDAGQTRRILAAARELRFRLRVQGDQRKSSGAARLAVEARAVSAEHLQRVTDQEIDLLAASETIATLLPTLALASAHGRDRYAPARRLADRGAAIALATGFGPASPTLSMPLVLSLACREMQLSPEEAIAAATVNGAASMGLADRLGSLEPGKQADLAVFDVRDYREIPYYFGFNLCVMTMKKGRIIHETKAAGSWAE